MENFIERYADGENESQTPFQNQKSPPISNSQHILHEGTRDALV